MIRTKIETLRAEPNGKDYEFWIYCYTLGKEEVFVNLARDLKTRICIPKDRWNRLEAIGIAGEHFISLSEQN